jgi:excisionase family DNA binding protein
MYYSQFEACKLLGVPYTTLRRWIQRYQIECRRSVAGKIRIGEESMQQLRAIKVMKQNNNRRR